MKAPLSLILAVFFAHGCGGPGEVLSTHSATPGTAPSQLARRQLEVDYRATVPVPEGARTLEVWMPLPGDDENQAVELASLLAPSGEIVFGEEEEFGSRMLYFRLAEPPERVEIGYRVRVARDEAIRRPRANGGGRSDRTKGDPEIAKWLQPDTRVPLDERIRALAAEVTECADTDLEKARAIYDHVVDTMSYDKRGTGWGEGDLYWACDARRGNCTDFHALFTGLARAAGIPAKFAIGFPIPAERGEGEVAGYHCWSEFWLEGHGWIPIDASEASKNPEKRDYYFGGHDENRVELTEGRDLVLAPAQQGEPLNFFVYPYAEADGRPLDGIERRFSYRDLAAGP